MEVRLPAPVPHGRVLRGAPCGPGCDGPGQGQASRSRTQGFRACQGSSPPPGAGAPGRRGVPTVAFRVFGARRHPGIARIGLNTLPAHAPVNASRTPLPTPAHDSEPVWWATLRTVEDLHSFTSCRFVRHTLTLALTCRRKPQRSGGCRRSGAVLC